MYEKIVTIESAAREPGGRSKIAVASRDGDVDPVGACVGMKGSRVQAVVQELRGERIDIVPWSPDPARYVCSALSPAAVSKVIIDEANQSMDVIVPDDQLSLAIGRRGQNVRLAVQLTGWRIDIKSESKMQEIAAWLAEAVSVVENCGEPEADLLLQQGITSLEDLADCQSDLLSSLPGIDAQGAQNIKERAAVLAVQKIEEEEQARLEAERLAVEEAAAAAAAAEAEAEADTEAEAEADTEVAAEADTEVAAEADTEVVAEADAEVVAEADAEVVAEADAEAEESAAAESDESAPGGEGLAPKGEG
jgi:N utilization substance protein A